LYTLSFILEYNTKKNKGINMIYIVKTNDTLFEIAKKFGTTISSILDANIICNPDFIAEGEPLLIPDSKSLLDIPKAGAGPYYITRPGDTLDCIANQVGMSTEFLAKINNIQNPNCLYSGSELLTVGLYFDTPEKLKELWETTPDDECFINGLADYGIYYIGSFQWIAYGEASIQPLLELLANPCEDVRIHAIMSLGRLALNGKVLQALIPFTKNNDYLSDIANIAIRRIGLRSMGLDRVHITMSDSFLSTESGAIEVPMGSEIVVLKWFVPNLEEEGPRGGYQVDDYVQIVKTGQIGFLPRAGDAAITFI
jgi:LysM repeat protein